MACPYFLPTEKFTDGTWPHPSRLPLGDGWRGMCTAPGQQSVSPCEEDLKEFCNLGYARQCTRFPAGAAADAVRFCVMRDRGDVIEVCFVFERDHLPGEFGTLEYDAVAGTWRVTHRDHRIQKMAACYLDAYLARRVSASAVSS
jgi:hypothetical protein